jgi:hypothetical protein
VSYRVAVEVKRIHAYDSRISYDSHDASPVDTAYIHRVLNKANDGAIRSNRNVCSADRWDAQILHVITSCDYVIDDVISWTNTIHDSGFAGVIVTHASGNIDLVF